MLRFIFVCMFLVAGAILTLAGQYMMTGINDARQSVMARNATDKTLGLPTTPQTGPTFEDIYATAPAPAPVETIASEDMSPEELNAIATTAGGDDNFGAAFTDTAPAALADEAPAVATEAMEPAAN